MRTVFVDTSAVVALMASTDRAHEQAVAVFDQLEVEGARLVTTSYVLLETYALIQRRLGVKAVSAFRTALAPALEVFWVDESAHETSLDDLVARGAGSPSLVDTTSFAVMRAHRIDHAFAFDRHFEAEGFVVLR